MPSGSDVGLDHGRRWVPVAAEAAVIAGLCWLFYSSFRLTSPVHGPLEVFGQDSVYILDFLVRGQPYTWNPQNHLLYHVLVELGHRPWQQLFGSGLESTYRYLKLFTAVTGLGFLIALRWLLCELKLGLGPRLVLLGLAGFSVSVWFHFAAFETHCVALSALVIYLVCLVRLRDRGTRSPLDRRLLVGSLLVMGWTRVDLFRFAIVSALLPMLPATRRWSRALLGDLAKVVVIGAIGSMALTSWYRGIPLEEAATATFERHDRRSLRDKVARMENVTVPNLIAIGRAVSMYSMLMPVEPRDPGRSFFAPPTYTLNLEWVEGADRPSTGLFLEPARNLLGSALPLVAALGLAALLATAIGASLRRIAAGDPLHAMLLAQAVFGWLFYTWFNPFEPFLWVVEYVPLWIVLIAELLRGRRPGLWIGLAALTVVLGLHNLYAFYLPFR